MKILALDPGGTTGYAVFNDTSPSPWIRDQLTGQHHLRLWGLLEGTWWDVVIYERFMYQRRELDRGVSLVLDSVEYIGVVKLNHMEREFVTKDTTFEVSNYKLICQTPAQAKNFWTDDKLKKIGLWIPNAPHAMDATRHLLYYLMMQQHPMVQGYLRLLKP